MEIINIKIIENQELSPIEEKRIELIVGSDQTEQTSVAEIKARISQYEADLEAQKNLVAKNIAIEMSKLEQLKANSIEFKDIEIISADKVVKK